MSEQENNQDKANLSLYDHKQANSNNNISQRRKRTAGDRADCDPSTEHSDSENNQPPSKRPNLDFVTSQVEQQPPVHLQDPTACALLSTIHPYQEINTFLRSLHMERLSRNA